jgi:TrmH family RNA methyltransferase
VAAGWSVDAVFATAGAADRDAELVAALGRVQLVSESVMAALTDTVSPQGLVGVVAMPAPPPTLPPSPRLVAVLCGVADPGNAGTVIRTADAAGAEAVVLTAGSVDVYGGKAVRSSAGSLFHLPVLTEADLGDVCLALRERGVRLLATTADGRSDVDELLDAGELHEPTAWLFGNEAHGLPDAAVAAAATTVRIPIRGRAESLNLAAASAICLYASARAQRR